MKFSLKKSILAFISKVVYYIESYTEQRRGFSGNNVVILGIVSSGKYIWKPNFLSLILWIPLYCKIRSHSYLQLSSGTRVLRTNMLSQ